MNNRQTVFRHRRLLHRIRQRRGRLAGRRSRPQAARQRSAQPRHGSDRLRQDRPLLRQASAWLLSLGAVILWFDHASRPSRLFPNEGEIGRPPALANGLRLVARARPAVIGPMPVGRLLRLPRERAMRPAVQQRPVHIGVDVGSEAEFSARLQHARETVEIDRTDEAPLPVLFLRPGIGIEKVDAVERGLRQPVEQARGVVVIDPKIGERPFPAPPSSSWPCR